MFDFRAKISFRGEREIWALNSRDDGKSNICRVLSPPSQRLHLLDPLSGDPRRRSIPADSGDSWRCRPPHRHQLLPLSRIHGVKPPIRFPTTNPSSSRFRLYRGVGGESSDLWPRRRGSWWWRRGTAMYYAEPTSPANKALGSSPRPASSGSGPSASASADGSSSDRSASSFPISRPASTATLTSGIHGCMGGLIERIAGGGDHAQRC